MIKEMKPLSMAEAKEIIEKHSENEEIQKHFKKFIKIKAEKSKELRKEVENLNNHKIRENEIVKIIDFLPEDASDLNKIFTDVSLDENEIKQIKEIVRKYR
jgi:DNA-directed RNA polymerase subunit F